LKHLKALVKLLSAQKTHQIEILSEDAQLSPKARALYEGIRDGSFDNDEEASLNLYNSDSKSSAYVKLKYRLKQRLINTVFFIDIQKYSRSPYEKALAQAYKNWAASKILQRKGLNQLSVDISESILKQTLKFDIIELSLLISSDLKLHYGLFGNKKLKFQRLSALNDELISKFAFRNEAQNLYIKYGKIVSSVKSFELISELDNDLARIDNMLRDDFSDDYYTRLYLFNSAYFIYLIKKDLTKQFELSSQAIEYFEAKPEFHKRGIFEFKMKMGVSLLGINKSEDAIKEFHDCLDITTNSGGIGWQYIHSYLFIAHTLNKNYNKAYDILCTVMDHPKFKTMYQTYKEPWYLKEAFINFLIRKNKINLDNFKGIKLRQFRISRFLNEVPQMTKDKKGLNISINIIQILFLMLDEEYDKVLDKLTALKQYSFRYLKKPEYARSSNFIKMLLKIPAGKYKANLIQKKAEKYYKFLRDNPMDYSEQSMNIEIIPYEQLWEEILSIFEKKARAVTT